LSPLLFVESEFEPNTRNDVIALTQNRIQVAFIDAPLTDLVSRMKDVEDAGTTLPLVFRKPPSELDHFVPFQDIVAPVNAQLTSQIGREETARLVDLLFSPTLARWDPFYHNLDFRRSIGTRMLDSLLKLAVTGRNLPAPILRWSLSGNPGMRRCLRQHAKQSNLNRVVNQLPCTSEQHCN
jgi:hypothetical protein